MYIRPFTVYPNPVTDNIVRGFLISSAPGKKELRVRIMNTLGEVVDGRTIFSEDGYFEMPLDPALPQSTYFISVHSEGGYYFEKIILAR